MDQQKVLSYALNQVQKKIATWLPNNLVKIWNGQLNESVFLVVLNIENSRLCNPREKLVLPVNNEIIEVPSPQMVFLDIAVVPAFSDSVEALDLSALIKRNIYDDRNIPLDEYDWYGNEKKGTFIEFNDDRFIELPSALQKFNPYRWDIRIQVGINSAKIEKVTRVKKRQFTAVKK